MAEHSEHAAPQGPPREGRPGRQVTLPSAALGMPTSPLGRSVRMWAAMLTHAPYPKFQSENWKLTPILSSSPFSNTFLNLYSEITPLVSVPQKQEKEKRQHLKCHSRSSSVSSEKSPHTCPEPRPPLTHTLHLCPHLANSLPALSLGKQTAGDWEAQQGWPQIIYHREKTLSTAFRPWESPRVLSIW